MKLLPHQASESTVKAILAAEIPQLNISHLQIKRRAWGRITVEVNNNIFLRFPLSKVHADKLLTERVVLTAIQNKTTFKVPQICFIGKQVAFDGYYKISGEPLSPESLSKLSEIQQYNFACQLAQFFFELHQAIDCEEGIEIGLKPVKEDTDDKITEKELRKRFLPMIVDKSQKKYAESVIQIFEKNADSQRRC